MIILIDYVQVWFSYNGSLQLYIYTENLESQYNHKKLEKYQPDILQSMPLVSIKAMKSSPTREFKKFLEAKLT